MGSCYYSDVASVDTCITARYYCEGWPAADVADRTSPNAVASACRGANVDRFAESMYQWAATMTQVQQRLRYSIMLRV
jgi:hypothetical protein